MGKRSSGEIVQYVRGHVVPDSERARSRFPGWAKRHDKAQERLTALIQKAPPYDPEGGYESTIEAAGIAAEVKRVSGPWGGWCLVLDTETTTDTRQVLRFGFFELHGIRQDERTRLTMIGKLTRDRLDSLATAGVFYNEAELTPVEVRTIQDYAAAHGLRCLSRDAFVTYFYKWVRRFGALVIGHNLPFDLSRLATRWTRGGEDMRSGFTFHLCTCSHRRKDGSRCQLCFKHPPITVRTIGHLKAFIRFASTPYPPSHAEGAEESSRYLDAENLRGRFLDTATLAAALLGGGTNVSLANLGRLLDIPEDHRKLETEEHGAALTFEYLDYARRDVEATWWVYKALREMYGRHGLSTKLWHIYSEASIGKAYLKEMGITPILARQPDFPVDVLGYGMAALYGARVEMRERLDPVEVEYCDFLSEYSTVNALLGLQDLLLAREIHVRRGPEVVKDTSALLLRVQQDIGVLQRPATWRQMRVLCLVRPDHDRLPFRGDFGPAGRNVALPLIEHGLPTWYALPDLVASTLLTNKLPEILDAVQLAPSQEKIGTRPLAFFGEPQRIIDPATMDIFSEVVSLRREIKEQRDGAKECRQMDSSARLDAQQLGLKLMASGTTYGLYVEVDEEDEHDQARPVTVHALSSWPTETKHVEMGGSYSFPPIGALITAGGRLLLTLAEKLAAEGGIGYAEMDTDAITPVRPEGMSREEFYAHVAEMRAWFTSLSPYRGQPPILEQEEQNRWPETKDGVRTPLHFLGIADKRYCLYNLVPDPDGPIERDGERFNVRLRKFSAHGLGVYGGREGYQPPAHIPEPHVGDRDVRKLGGPRWCHDLWYDAIVAIETRRSRDGRLLLAQGEDKEGGCPRYFVPTRMDEGGEGAHQWLCEPAYYQVTVSTWNLLTTYSADYDGHLADLRPFSFFTLLPSFDRRLAAPDSIHMRMVHAELDGNARLADVYRALPAGQPFIGPYVRTPQALALQQARRTFGWYDSKQHCWRPLPAEVRTPTLAESVREYYQRPAYKSPSPRGRGTRPIPVIPHVDRIAVIGKETNAVALLTADETDDHLMGAEAGMEGAQVYGVQLDGPAGIVERLRAVRLSDVQLVTELSRRELSNLRSGKTTHPTPETVAVLSRGLWLLDNANPDGIAGWRDAPNDDLARHVGSDWTSEDIQGVRNGTRPLTPEEHERFIVAIRTWQRENAVDEESEVESEVDARDQMGRLELEAREYVNRLRQTGTTAQGDKRTGMEVNP